MISITIHCPYCQSDALMRNGRAPNGKQNSLCRPSHRQSQENPVPPTYWEECREEILRAYEERSSLAALNETLIEPDANDVEATVLELDERWSSVWKKTNHAWSWIALCRKTRHVVADAVGDEGKRPGRLLVGGSSSPFSKRSLVCTDFWSGDQTVLPERKPVKRLMCNVGITRSQSAWLADDAHNLLLLSLADDA